MNARRVEELDKYRAELEAKSDEELFGEELEELREDEEVVGAYGWAGIRAFKIGVLLAARRVEQLDKYRAELEAKSDEELFGDELVERWAELRAEKINA